MKKLYILPVFLALSILSFAQTTAPYFGNIQWASGYSREISGENISYYSIFPEYATTALLTRCTNGQKTIEWETAPVPGNVKGKYVYFSWVAAHSSGTSGGIRHFDLYLNDEKLLTFTTFPAHEKPDWIFSAEDSSALVFQQIKRDAPNDAHGLAFLRLPMARVKPGLPVKLKVAGQAQNSNDWFMTFKFSFEERVEVQPMPFLLNNGKQTLSLTALHFGKDQELRVTVNKKEVHSFQVHNGVNKFDIPVNAVQKEDSVLVHVVKGKRVFMNNYQKFKPVHYRVLHFIHHSHTDIGDDRCNQEPSGGSEI
jgi:alpha-mannosidase